MGLCVYAVHKRERAHNITRIYKISISLALDKAKVFEGGNLSGSRL